MTDEIRIEAEGTWTITVNGVEVASSGEPPVPPDPDEEWPAPIASSEFWAMEVTDPADPLANGGKRSGCRRIGIDAEVVEPDGYELWATSSQFDGGSTDGASRLAPGQSKGYQNAVATGEKRYQLAWWRNKETGEFRGALPPTGQSGTGGGVATAQPLEPSSLEPDRGQVVLTMQGLSGNVPPPDPEPSGDWPVIPPEYVARGLALPMPKFGNKGNSSFNLNNRGQSLLATLYAWRGGDRRSEVRSNIMSVLSQLTSTDKGPCGMSGPGAAQECFALAFFHLLADTDLWKSDVTDTQKKRIDAIFHALAMIRAWEGNDSSASSGSWTITGMKGTDFKGVGPNIAYAIPAQLTLCAEWFGYDVLSGWLDQATIAGVRNEVKEAFGTSSNLYLTVNWKNAGISAADEGAYYRSGASADAPTDSQVNSSLKNLRYYGAPLTDLAKFLLPNDSRGLNRVLPPTKRTMGANKWVGYNAPALNNGAGVMVNGKKRGYCIKDPEGMPWYGQEGSMIYELAGQDEGGLRSCMGYAFWTLYLVNFQLIVIALNQNPALKNSAVADFVARWEKARDIVAYFDQKDYNSVAHISNKGGTGGPGPIIWSDDRDKWEADTNLWMWDAIVTMSKVE